MKYQKTDNRYVVRLDKGEQLMECLQEIIAAESITAAWVNGLGGAANAELGYYDLKALEYHWHKFDELMEITSLQGNVSTDELNQPVVHLHGSFSRADFSAIGGHVKELEVGGTVELLITEVPLSLVRRQDDAVGLKLLDL
jgi:predicted DNA-binding protein with PD1-like motif